MAKTGATGARPLMIVLAASAAALSLAGPARAGDRVDAVTTSGSGTLTMCRNWLVYDSCATYHRIAVPRRIAIGDRLRLTFGSNPKDYVFHVARLVLQGAACTILSDDDRGGTGEKIEAAGCRAAANPATDAR